MSSESPASILYSSDGYELSVVSGVAVPANTRGIMTVGSDGTTARFIKTDTSGNEVVVGLGTAGTPLGGVITIQGVSGGTAIPVSGTVTATNPSVGSTGSSVPTSASMSGGSVTTAAPTYITGNLGALSLNTSGGLRVDGSGTTQPVSGTVVANAGTGSFTVAQATAANLNATVIGSGNFTVIQPTAASLNATIVGLGLAGTPLGGVLSIQGVAGGQAIPVSGTLTVSKSSTGTITSVASATTSTTLLAANTNRIGATFYNDSTSILYLGLTASAVSTSSYSIRIMPNSYYDLPVAYTGQITGIWNAAQGFIRVTELV